MAKKSYTVTYQRDTDGWWVANIRRIKGCHTQGKNIAQARTRIRECLGLFIGDSCETAISYRVALLLVGDNVPILNGSSRAPPARTWVAMTTGREILQGSIAVVLHRQAISSGPAPRPNSVKLAADCRLGQCGLRILRGGTPIAHR